MWVILPVLLLYFAAALWIRRGMSKLSQPSDIKDIPSISVLIPLRNEVRNTENLIKSLSQLDYSFEQVEFIFIDDHSTDSTLEHLIAQVDQTQFIHVQFIKLPTEKEGKKQAILAGLTVARNEIVAQTDADCRPDSTWLQSVSRVFRNSETRMAFGPVTPMQPRRPNWVNQLSTLEYAMTHALSVGFLGQGHALTCSGANIAYRRDWRIALEKKMMGNHLASGDDHFLLKTTVHQHGIGSVSYINSSVQTKLPGHPKTLTLQKKRWISKLATHMEIPEKTTAMLVLVSNLCLLTLPFINLFWFALSWVIFSLSDWVMMKAYSKLSGQRLPHMGLFLGLRFLYAAWSVALIPAVLLTTGEWKGRKI